MRRKSEVIPIPDIRERNDRPKDKQPKHQAASTVQRQMVQKFVKELNDSTKQSDRSDSAERTATEQVETTAREIIREAAQFSRKAHHRTNAPHTRPGRPQPQSVSPPICEKPTLTELRGEPRPNRHQKMRRTFGISSRLAHGRRVPLNHLPCAALNVLSENAQQMHRRMIYRPRRRRRHGKPLQKASAALSKSIHRIHLSIRIGCPDSTAAACFGSTCNRTGASVGHGWQRQTGPTCPATNTSAHPASGAAARHP